MCGVLAIRSSVVRIGYSLVLQSDSDLSGPSESLPCGPRLARNPPAVEVHDKYRELPPGVPGTAQTAKEVTQVLRSHGIRVCRPCHSAVHRMATNEDLGRLYYTLEKVRSEQRPKGPAAGDCEGRTVVESKEP